MKPRNKEGTQFQCKHHLKYVEDPIHTNYQYQKSKICSAQ